MPTKDGVEIDLADVLAKHDAWLHDDQKGKRADLSEANLSGDNLSEANLSGANLSGAVGGAICRMDFGGWSICIRAAATSIGCQTHANESWMSWSPESPEIVAMHRGAPEWWRVHGDAIKSAIRCVMAKATRGETA